MYTPLEFLGSAPVISRGFNLGALPPASSLISQQTVRNQGDSYVQKSSISSNSIFDQFDSPPVAAARVPVVDIRASSSIFDSFDSPLRFAPDVSSLNPTNIKLPPEECHDAAPSIFDEFDVPAMPKKTADKSVEVEVVCKSAPSIFDEFDVLLIDRDTN